MSWFKVIAVAWTTFMFIVLSGLAFGFSQMGDCFPDGPELQQCLAAKASVGNVVWAVCGLLYIAALWLILRRRKLR